MSIATITVPRRIAERIRREAEKAGISTDEYIVELLTQGLDPPERAKEYIEAARSLVEEAWEELKKGNVRQAAEKTWGAAALAVKAYAYWKEGRRLTSHRELWMYTDIIAKEFGEWVNDAWNQAGGMHICFYEGWCSRSHVEAALKQVSRLVDEIARRITNADP